MVDRIAYVDSHGDVHTVNPDGSDSRKLTGAASAHSRGMGLAQLLRQGDVAYAWPTWSPDGAAIAVSRTVLEDGTPKASILTLDASNGAMTKVYDNEPGASPVIAEAVPHYMYWSPDSRSLAFIAATPTTLALLVSAEDGRKAAVSQQGPIYFRWAADSGSMLIHSGDTLERAAAPFEAPPVEIAPMSPVFRAPDLSADGRRAAYVTGTGQDASLLVGDPAATGSFAPAAPVEGGAAILWSPTDDLIAVADTPSSRTPGHNRLRVIAPDGSQARPPVEEPLAAFFWSPDGARIAYVSLDVERRRLVWKVAPVDGGEPWELVGFIPSPETLTAISFFDQYAHSHSVWSPDGASLVFAGRLANESVGTNGASPSASSVYVIGAEPGSVPKKIATGSVAFWSWN